MLLLSVRTAIGRMAKEACIHRKHSTPSSRAMMLGCPFILHDLLVRKGAKHYKKHTTKRGQFRLSEKLIPACHASPPHPFSQVGSQSVLDRSAKSHALLFPLSICLIWFALALPRLPGRWSVLQLPHPILTHIRDLWPWSAFWIAPLMSGTLVRQASETGWGSASRTRVALLTSPLMFWSLSVVLHI